MINILSAKCKARLHDHDKRFDTTKDHLQISEIQ